MIPDFDVLGNLPPGIHTATMAEIEKRFGYNSHRRSLIEGLKRAIKALKIAGCRTVYLDGSFVTNKVFPKDYDGCWDTTGMDPTLLDPILLIFTPDGRRVQKIKYGGELFIAGTLLNQLPRLTSLQFFQQDRSGNQKGIIRINL